MMRGTWWEGAARGWEALRVGAVGRLWGRNLIEICVGW